VVYAFFPLGWFENLGFLAFLGAVAALLLVFIPGLGYSVNGSLRWVNLGGLRVQPSELAKFLFIIYLAGFITRRHELLMKSWKSFAAPLSLLAILAVLLLGQPDFGTLVVVGTTTLGMLFLAGVPLVRFITLVLVRSEEHTSELQSRFDLVCRLLLEKKNVACSQVRASHYHR